MRLGGLIQTRLEEKMAALLDEQAVPRDDRMEVLFLLEADAQFQHPYQATYPS